MIDVTFLNYMLQLFVSCVPLWNNYVIYLFTLAFLATVPYIICWIIGNNRR